MATATTAQPNDPTIAPANADSLYEVVNGQVVEKPLMGAHAGEIATLLAGFLVPFVRTHRLGKVVGEVLFLIDAAKDLQRRPDMAFVSDARWPHDQHAPDTTWEIVPDLAIEVVSPTNRADEVVAKVREYFHAGVQRVWVVYPKVSQIYVYESPTSNTILQVGDELDGAPLLPGFRLSVATLFE